MKTLKTNIHILKSKQYTPLNASYVARNKLYHSKEWTVARRKHLLANPTCIKCGKKANTVDHSKMHHIGLDKFGKTWLYYFWMPEFYVSYCSSCHSRKTTHEHQKNKPQRMSAAERARLLAGVKQGN